VAAHKSYVDDFIEVMVDMGYRIKDVTFCNWCIWVTVVPRKDGVELDDIDADIVDTVKRELRAIAL
jgi:hypothetical protein